MTLLAVSCAAFLVLHIGVSSTPLRGVLRNAAGENGYLGIYSLLAFVSLGAMVYFYAGADHSDFIWAPSSVAYKITKIFLLLAIVLIVVGAVTKNPTAVKMEDAISDDLPGVLRITRHPLQWGILLEWAASRRFNGEMSTQSSSAAQIRMRHRISGNLLSTHNWE